MKNENADNIRNAVRERYGSIARSGSSGCGCTPGASGFGPAAVTLQDASTSIGYSARELESVPDGANLGLGCGNPVALAAIETGATVLDLGSGAGFDAFLAAQRVGETGRVIGVDMTPEMITKARENARKAGYENVEFRLGEIENLPVADNTIDLVLSNCVINLSPDKQRVFAETVRVLKPGGKLMISDIVLLRPLPEAVKNSVEAYVGCLAGATLKKDYLNLIISAGFTDVKIVEESSFPVENISNDSRIRAFAENTGMSPEDVEQAGRKVLSIRVSAAKPL